MLICDKITVWSMKEYCRNLELRGILKVVQFLSHLLQDHLSSPESITDSLSAFAALAEMADIFVSILLIPSLQFTLS